MDRKRKTEIEKSVEKADLEGLVHWWKVNYRKPMDEERRFTMCLVRKKYKELTGRELPKSA